MVIIFLTIPSSLIKELLSGLYGNLDGGLKKFFKLLNGFNPSIGNATRFCLFSPLPPPGVEGQGEGGQEKTFELLAKLLFWSY
jgi:hypothetical protein